MIIIEIIQYTLAIVIGVLLGYQLLVGVLTLKTKRKNSFSSDRKRRFAIVLNTHNDEKVIAKSLYSLFGLVYPKNLYDVIVVADNSTDNTALKARELGAIVLERNSSEESGEVNVLQWSIEQILEWPTAYDAILIFEPDSLVSGNYLDVMNYYLDNGSKVIQSRNLVLPDTNDWRNKVQKIGFLNFNFLRLIARKIPGITMGSSNGTCFTVGVLHKYAHLTLFLEDIEYKFILQLKGINIDFAPEAITWEPFSGEPKKTNNKWWKEYLIISRYAPKLIKAIFERKSFSYLKNFLNLITPPLISILLFSVVMGITNIVLSVFFGLSFSLVLLWGGIIALGIIHLFVGLYAINFNIEANKSAL